MYVATKMDCEYFPKKKHAEPPPPQLDIRNELPIDISHASSMLE